MNQKGFANLLLIIFGFILVAFIVGFFASRKSYSPIMFPNVTGDANSPFTLYSANKCGLSVTKPAADDFVTSTIVVSGYINGCGWSLEGQSAGTVQVLNASGQVISGTYNLFVPSHSPFSASYFSATVYVNGAKTDTGSLLFRNNAPLDKSEIIVLPINFK